MSPGLCCVLPESETMCPSELHRKILLLNGRFRVQLADCQSRFHKVLIFRDVGNRFHQLVSDFFAAIPTGWKDPVESKNYGGPGFVVMTNFIYARFGH